MCECNECGAAFSERRALLGYHLCLTCGEKAARAVKHCTVPVHKSNYVVITNREELRGLNSKSVPT